MSVSSAPALKKALKTALLARPGLQGVQLSWDQPTDKEERETIVLGDIDETQDWAPFGQLKKDEDYNLEIIVLVTAGFLDDREELADRAMDLLEEIASQLRSDPTVGGAINIAAQIIGFKQQSLANSAEGWSQSVITSHVRCMSRI